MPTNPLRQSELDPTSYPAFRDGILAAESFGQATPQRPRSYPGYPSFALPRIGPRWFSSLDRALRQRRCHNQLSEALPDARALARLLSAHAITGEQHRGPTPSAGGLQCVELYLGILNEGWLTPGLYHYDRVEHRLARLTTTTREELQKEIPSMDLVQGGSIVWMLVGDGRRARAKYGERGLRFLLLEAGHLMQNLCLLSTSVGLITTPLGGYFENALARRLGLLREDEVLYVGICGTRIVKDR
jgi:SagB-type dehydrogenase family enzyme